MIKAQKFEDRIEDYWPVFARVAKDAKLKAIDDCLEIVRCARDDFKGNSEAAIALHDVERLLYFLKRTRA